MALVTGRMDVVFIVTEKTMGRILPVLCVNSAYLARQIDVI